MERKLRKQSHLGENQELLPSFEASTTSPKRTILMQEKSNALVEKTIPNSMETPPLVSDSVGTERTTAVLKKIQLKKVERSKSLLNENLDSVL